MRQTKHHELLWYPDTYDVARGLVLIGVGGVVRREGPSLLGPSGLPSWGGLPFLLSPRWGRGLFFLLLVFAGGFRLGVIGQ